MTHKRHFADGRKVLFIASQVGRTEVVATAVHSDWALRIAEALNKTDPRRRVAPWLRSETEHPPHEKEARKK
jgi:hypothetical protein